MASNREGIPTIQAEDQLQKMQKMLASPSVVIGAIHTVMSKVGFVQKRGENEFHHYKYATESDTIAALRSEMLNAGLVMMPSIYGQPVTDENGNTTITMAYTFYHVPSGERLTIYIPGSGNDRSSKGTVGDKGIYKAMTGALKYALRQTFMLETGDDPESGNEVDANATTERNAVAGMLAFADKMINEARMCNSPVDLQSMWVDNIKNIDLLKQEHHELWTKVRDAFSARKKALTPPPIVDVDNGGT